jgi:mannose-6-phosphate isomerase-like protein (cupin superfamily)
MGGRTAMSRRLNGSLERGFETKTLPQVADAVAPDGLDVRVLLEVRGGGLAHFELAARQTSVAVRHTSVEEIWYFLRGSGEMWRKSRDEDEVVGVSPGVCITIPLGTAFQFRVTGDESLAAVAATIPPWPGAGEAVIVAGPWKPTVDPGPV